MKPLSILILNWYDVAHPWAGGAELYIHEVFKRIVSSGNNVTMMTVAFPGARAQDEIDGVHILRRGKQYSFNYSLPILYHKELSQKTWDHVVDCYSKIPFFAPLNFP